MDKSRLLIASTFPHFLTEWTVQFAAEFELQRANSEDVVNFLAKEWAPHVLLLDADCVLFNSCDRIRSRFPFETMGIILVTREFTPIREEKALRMGCDQIINYPTGRDPLFLRVRTLLRRVQGFQAGNGSSASTIRSEPIVLGELQVLPMDHMIKRGERAIPMTPIQFKLLMMFLKHKDQLLSRQWIKDTIWERADISLRSIDAQISKLRKIVPELDPHLVNVYGKGYVFTVHRREAA
jgi:two-component system, OmpR family, phosphate regulon response regulator PhoB